MKWLSRFKSNCNGNTSVMLALALMPLCLGAGAAIDFARHSHASTVLQAAADAAAIAGGASGKTDAASLKVIVEDYLQSNGAIEIMSQVDSIDPVMDNKKQSFSVRIKGKRNTSLMYLAGVSSLDLEAFSEVSLAGQGLEVAMVLDTTGSMNEGTRLTALKSAAGDFVDKLLGAEAAGAYVRVGLVPFGEYVNVGMGVRSEPWMNVPNDTTTKVNECTNTYPNATSSNCRVENYTAYNDGIPYPATANVCDWNYGDPVEVCNEVLKTTKWHGCVGSRNEPLDEDIGTPSSPYPGLPNTSCGSEIVPMTKSAATLNATINNLVAVGNTYIPAGLLWGWNMVDGDAPLDEAKSAAELAGMRGQKVIVLMTDGDNTKSADYPWHWGNDAPKADAKTAALCENIKNDDIIIYTVSFMVTDPDTIDMLKTCATDSSKALTANNTAQLADAFEAVGANLLAMRLTK